MVKSTDTALTIRVTSMVNSFKRQLCQRKQKVKKGSPFPIDIFWLMAEREVYPFELELYKINSSNFRAIFRAIFIYFTFCRFSDFSILTDRDFRDHGHFIEVVFKKSKNDQYHEGTNSILARLDRRPCPVELVRLYFKKFQLKFADQPGTEARFLNFRIAKRGLGREIPLPHKSLSQSTATEKTRLLLQRYGMDTVAAKKFTEKSMKIAGVTALCDSGEPLENVAIAGRWRTMTTPLYYRNTSKNFRVKVAKNIPLSNNA